MNSYAEHGIDIIHVPGRVVSITANSPDYRLLLDSGKQLVATDVVIAIGLGEPKAAQGLRGISPYPSARLRRFAGRNVLVVGQGQSGIEAALVLCSEGARVTMCSRTGQFPAVRTRSPLHKTRIDPITDKYSDFRSIVEKDCLKRGFPPLRNQLVRLSNSVAKLREEIRLAECDLCPWQDSVIPVIDAVIDADRPMLDDHEFIWRYATAINLPTAQRLLNHIDDGSIVTALIHEIDPARFDAIVMATGFLIPSLYCENKIIYFDAGSSQRKKIDSITNELRLIIPGKDDPERIWAIGPVSGIRVPFANFLHTAVRQAHHVAHQIAAPRFFHC